MSKHLALAELKANPELAQLVPDFVTVTHENDLGAIERGFSSKVTLFAVRSSAESEDTLGESRAGKHLSLLGVSRSSLKLAVRKVLNSYELPSPNDKVLVQEFVDDSILSGVAISRSPIPGFTQLRIEWYPGVDTAAVTSGSVRPEVIQTKLFENHDFISRKSPNTDWNEFFRIFELIQGQAGDVDLDVEFCLSKSRGWTIFQSRKLRGSGARIQSEKRSVVDEQLRAMFSQSNKSGKEARQIFGSMPDWNPAELLGRTAPRLDSSLFSYLVSDSSWSQGRAELGYRDSRNGVRLAQTIGASTFIDVRASAQSLIPAGVPSEVSEKAVSAMMEKLWNQPELHDRVEFEVYVAEFSAMARSKLENLGLSKFEAEEYLDSLKDLTRRAIRLQLPNREKFERDFMTSKSLVAHLPENSRGVSAESIQALIESERNRGWNEYSKTSRLAFMAHSILRDAQITGEISQEEIDSFHQQITSPAKELRRTLASGDDDRLRKLFGHLRPGNFDITSKRLGFERSVLELQGQSSSHGFLAEVASDDRLSALPDFETLRELEISPQEFSAWALNAIENREWHKFFLGKGLDLILSSIASLASSAGLSEELVSHLSISEITHTNFLQSSEIKSVLAERRAFHNDVSSLEFPHLFDSVSSATCFEHMSVQATYIGADSIKCSPVKVTDDDSNLEGRILFLESADPGYDFLLASGIAGLVTAYGGENSHMAVRCRELGLTAAIGVGIDEFRELSMAKNIQICTSRKRVIEF